MKSRVSVFIIILHTLIGCSGRDAKTYGATPSIAKEFAFPLYPDIVTLDPARVQEVHTINVLQNVYECLVRYNEKNQLEPCLAEKWAISKDRKTYTFFLKKGVKFHNGQELNAEDVKYSFERACSPLLKSPVAKTFLSDIVGVEDRLNGKSNAISGIRVVAPYMVEITLKEPKSYFISKLGYIATAIVPKSPVPSSEIIEIKQSIGTGPYKLVQYIPGQEIKLMAYSNYHGKKASVEQIRIPIIKDTVTSLYNYNTGRVSYYEVPPAEVKAVMADPKLKNDLHSVNNAFIAYLEFNPKFKPFDNRKVRQAIAMAIDKEKIVNGPLDGLVEVAHAFLPKETLGYRSSADSLQFNVPRARELLAQAGYPNGKGLPSLVMCVDSELRNAHSRRTIENITMQLKNNLNISTNIRVMGWKSMITKLNAKQFSARWAGWVPDYLDPASSISELFTTHAALNLRHYSNPLVDSLCAQADSHPDLQERLKLYAQAEDIILNDAIIVPLYTKKVYYLKKRNVEGLRYNLFGVMPYTDLVVK